MKVVATALPTPTPVLASAPPLTESRVGDYLELVRPRMTLLVLFTVGTGAFLAAPGAVAPGLLAQAVIGTALVAAGASCLNQLLERHTDALMRRTENRPLPAGRLQPSVVLTLGIVLTVAGLVCLLLCELLAAAVAAFTFVTYVFLYTPLKRKTPLNTLVGAVPGALPPVIGWTAVRGSLDAGAIALFLIVFLWQVPHFLAIAWIYRDQYARAGLKMLPVLDRDGVRTGREMVRYCAMLVPVSLVPAALGVAGLIYGIGAVLLGLMFLRASLGFVGSATTGQARRVLRASLLYLPALLALLLADGLVARLIVRN
jgi:protoheme IX farnesyltransferase